jgi:CHASE1-domain containing sensor protein
MSKICSLLKKLVLVLLSLFVVTFVVYFFNLDMKLTAAMEPVLNWFYDRVDRDQHL